MIENVRKLGNKNIKEMKEREEGNNEELKEEENDEK